MDRAHRNCGPLIVRLAAALGWLAAGTLCPPASGQAPPSAGGALGPLVDVEGEFYRLVRKFDFDERAAGNFEDTPMYWVRMRGPGLPPFATGVIDDAVGHTAPPSFRLSIQTGNVGYEYRNLDLMVLPHCDYFVVGHIRAVGLEHSRAFLAAYLINRFGERIAGSERVSDLVQSTGRADEPWQRVSLALSSDWPDAYALRIQVWLLQSYVWRDSGPPELDPIIRRDVYATAWFDDLQVYRLPRARLRFTNPGGIVAPGASEAFVLDVNNTFAQQLTTELTIADVDGRVVHTQVFEMSAAGGTGVPDRAQSAPAAASSRPGTAATVAHLERAAATMEAPFPALPPGLYDVRLRLRGAGDALMDRFTRVAVLPELPGSVERAAEFGVDLGAWPDVDPAGALALLDQLGCGSVKIGIAAAAPGETARVSEQLARISSLVALLTENRLEATGVMLASASTSGEAASPTWRVVRDGDAWRERFSPMFAHLGGLLPAWQLGQERVELASADGWDERLIGEVRGHLKRFVTLPRLIVPESLLAVEQPGDDITSVFVPADTPTRSFAAQLDFLADEARRTRCWLALEAPPETAASAYWRSIDLVRRVALAAALAPQRVFVPAPFASVAGAGELQWEPNEHYIPLRTLLFHLGGLRCVRVMRPEPRTLALIFQGARGACLVIWTWRDAPADVPVELYLAGDPKAMDVFGRPVPIESRQGKTRITVGPAPILVRDFDPYLAQLHASYSLSPNYVEVHTTEPRPVLAFENPYLSRLQGEVRLTPPPSWRVEPDSFTFSLEPGERLEQPLTLISPPRQVASTYEMGVQLRLHAPATTVLEFREPITLGLRGLFFDAHAFWQGDTLVVEQTLRNLTEEPVSFTAFCEAAGRARAERLFLEVQPGEAKSQLYVYPNARSLAGSRLYVGAEEIRGPRSLNQLVLAPP